MPSASPSDAPSTVPSIAPTYIPSSVPSASPTDAPSFVPSTAPTYVPSFMPSASPSDAPSSVASTAPTYIPSFVPSASPSYTPSALPSLVPSGTPSIVPSYVPSNVPSDTPSVEPSTSSSDAPSTVPSSASTPAVSPTFAPSTVSCPPSTTAPSTSATTMSPTYILTDIPTSATTYIISRAPSTVASTVAEPTITPTKSDTPSTAPSSVVTITSTPSLRPTTTITTTTYVPTIIPSRARDVPTYRPSSASYPSQYPTNTQTFSPSQQPSRFPSYVPTFRYSYDQFNSSVLLLPTPPYDLFYSYWANNNKEYINSFFRWNSFLLRLSDNPFNIQYKSIEVYVEVLEYGATQLRQQRYVCNDQSITNILVQSLFVRINKIDIICNRSNWMVRNGSLGVDCDTNLCPIRGSGQGVAILPTTSCLSNYPPKAAGFVSISHGLIPTVDIPAITNVAVVSYQSKVTVHVSLDRSVGGRIYCGRFPSGYQTVSASLVKLQGYSYNYVPESESVVAYSNDDLLVSNVTVIQLDIDGMIPLTIYDIYCYAESFFAVAGSMGPVIGPRVVTTLCCRNILFTSSPPYILTDYSSDSTSTFPVFRYSLDSLPNSYIIVTPTVYFLNGTMATGVNVSPFNMVFTNSSISTMSSFIVTGFQPSQYRLNLRISGSSANEYYTDSAIFTLIDIFTNNLPSPELMSASFSNNGAFVLVVFNSPTDEGGIMASSWPCDELLDFRLANISTCAWLNSTSVQITMSTSSDHKWSELLMPGDVITLIATVCSVCYDWICVPMCTNESTAIVKAPLSAESPVIVLSIPAKSCVCDNLVIDASKSMKSGGRNWVNSTLVVASSTNNNVYYINSYLAHNFDAFVPIAVPSDLLAPGFYSFHLMLTNFLMKSSMTSVNVEISAPANPVPTVIIHGQNYRNMNRYDPLVLSVTSTLSSCTQEIELSFHWQIFHDYLPVSFMTSASNDPRKFMLLPYQLQTNNLYTIMVTVSMPSGISASATCEVFVSSGGVYAVILGGNKRVLPQSQPFQLDASLSRSKDSPNTDSSEQLSFRWSCTILTISNYGESCNGHITNSLYSPVIDVRSGILDVGLLYLFEVLVTDISSGTSSTANVEVSVIINASTIVSISSTYSVFNANNKIKISAFINTSVSVVATWQLQGSAIISLSDAGVALTQISRNFTVTPPSFFNINFPLCVSPLIFDGKVGKTFTFVLSVRPITEEDDANSVTSSISLTVNTAPFGGMVEVYPTVGIALTTIFSCFTTKWMDIEGNFPLVFKFTYNIVGVPLELTLGLPSEASSASSALPCNMYSDITLISINVYANDTYGAVSSMSTIVHVTPHHGTLAMTEMQSNLSNALLRNDCNYAMQLMNMHSLIMSQANCSSVPIECYKLNRNNCSIVPHTCGECWLNFDGIAGSSNTPCVAKLDNGVAQCNETSCSSGNCVEVPCQQLPKSCTSDILQAGTCSGHGRCVYMDNDNDEILSQCSTYDSHCSAQCICQSGYFGVACSITSAEISVRNNTLMTLCDIFLSTYHLQDFSIETLAAFSSTLLQILSIDGIEFNYGNCLQSLQLVVDIASAGFFDSSSRIPVNIFSTISILLEKTNSKSSEATRTILISSLQSLIDSVFRDALEGQAPLTFTTTNIRLTVYFESSQQLLNKVIHLPATLTSTILNQKTSSSVITLPSTGLQACGYTNNSYIPAVALEWGRSPYNTSTELKNRVFRFSVGKSSSTTIKSQSTYYAKQYFGLILQFAHSQAISNRNPPNCSLISSSTGDLLESGCVLQNYTAMNATFSCPLQQLCPNNNNDDVSMYQSGYSSKSLNANDVKDKIIHGFLDNNNNILLANTNKRKLIFDYQSGSSAFYGGNHIVQFGGIVSYSENTLTTKVGIYELNRSALALSLISIYVSIVFICLCFFLFWDSIDHKIIVYIQNFNLHDINQKEMLRRGSGSSVYTDVEVEKGVSFSSSAKFPSEALENIPVSDFYLNSDLVDFRKDNPMARQAISLRVPNFIRMMSNFSFVDDNNKIFENKLSRFFAKLFPDIDGNHSGINLLIRAILRYHEYLNMFSYPSLRVPRTIRFLVVCTNILILVFIDTFVYNYYFPSSDPNCTKYSISLSSADTTEDYVSAAAAACTSAPDRWNPRRSLCTWHSDTLQCVRCPVPQTVDFFAEMALIIVLASIVPQMLMKWILISFCSRRPELEKFGLLTTWWLGSSSEPSIYGTARKSDLGKALEQSQYEESEGAEEKLSGGSVEERNTYYNYVSKRQGAVKYLYTDLMTAEEEMEVILNDINSNIFNQLLHMPIPWKTNSDDTIRMNALMSYAGVYPDGSFIPLTLWEKIVYETPENKFILKIKNARKEEKKLLNKLRSVGAGEHDVKDMILIQHFVSEQINAFKRPALLQELYRFDHASPAKIHPITWLVSWVVVIFLWLFFFIWILKWSIGNDPNIYRVWFIQFAYVLIQDIFLYQIIQIYITHVLILQLMKPQLRRIRNVLSTIVTEKTKTKNPSIYSNINSSKTPTTTSMNNMKVMTSEKSNESNMAQHLSPACRASRSREAHELASAKVLMLINDDDVMQCRETRDDRVGILGYILLALPTALSSLPISIQDSVSRVIFPLLGNCFLLVNWSISESYPALLAVLYIMLFLYIIFKVVIIKYMRERGLITTGSKYNGTEKTINRRNIGCNNYINQHQYLIYLHDILSYFFAKKSSNENLTSQTTYHNILWRNMNLANHLQGNKISVNYTMKTISIRARKSLLRSPSSSSIHGNNNNNKNNDDVEDRVRNASLGLQPSTYMYKNNKNNISSYVSNHIRNYILSDTFKKVTNANKTLIINFHTVDHIIERTSIQHILAKRWIELRRGQNLDSNSNLIVEMFMFLDEDLSGYLEINELGVFAKHIW